MPNKSGLEAPLGAGVVGGLPFTGYRPYPTGGLFTAGLGLPQPSSYFRRFSGMGFGTNPFMTPLSGIQPAPIPPLQPIPPLPGAVTPPLPPRLTPPFGGDSSILRGGGAGR